MIVDLFFFCVEDSNGKQNVMYAVDFGDVLTTIACKKEITFINHTNQCQRISFVDIEFVQLEPHVMHVKPHQKRNIQMTFISNENVKIENQSMIATFRAIELKNP
jgi:hypothetical protein